MEVTSYWSPLQPQNWILSSSRFDGNPPLPGHCFWQPALISPTPGRETGICWSLLLSQPPSCFQKILVLQSSGHQAAPLAILGHSSSPSWKTLAPDSYSLQCYSWEIRGDSSIHVHSPHSTLASGFLNFPSSTESLSAPTPVGTCLALSSRTVLMETSWIYAVQYGGHLSHLAFTRG